MKWADYPEENRSDIGLFETRRRYFVRPRITFISKMKVVFFFFIFYILQLFLAVAVRRPIPHTAHLRDRSTGSIGYSYEVRPTFWLLPWAISPTHCTTRTQLTTIDIRPATVKAVYATLYSPEASLLQE